VLVDVDHFKAVNDELGHDAGDVLRDLPRRVLNQLRAYDGVGRYGGEEFLLVLPGCQLLDCVTRAEKIRVAVAEQPFTVPDGLRPVTISMGAAVALPGVENAQDELLKQADVALYEAKHNGRNHVRAYDAAESVVLQSRESERAFEKYGGEDQTRTRDICRDRRIILRPVPLLSVAPVLFLSYASRPRRQREHCSSFAR
jgi:diguanylate cyclase (GGDEF)-like protein